MLDVVDGVKIYDYFLGLLVLWNLIMFFPMLFAAIRRYHDAGISGWKAVVFIIAGRLCPLAGVVIGTITLLFLLFSAGVSVNESGFWGLMAFSGLLLLAGILLSVVNLVFLLRPSELLWLAKIFFLLLGSNPIRSIQKISINNSINLKLFRYIY